MDMISAYNAMGITEYGPEKKGRMGIFEGSVVKVQPDRIGGMIEHRMKGTKLGVNHYLLGRSHIRGLSLLHIPPYDDEHPVAIWALNEDRGIYRGCWMPLESNIATVGLASYTSLSDLLGLDVDKIDILSAGYFDHVLQDGEAHGHNVVLDLKETDLNIVRKELRI